MLISWGTTRKLVFNCMLSCHVRVYELSVCGFEPRCCHLNLFLFGRWLVVLQSVVSLKYLLNLLVLTYILLCSLQQKRPTSCKLEDLIYGKTCLCFLPILSKSLLALHIVCILNDLFFSNSSNKDALFTFSFSETFHKVAVVVKYCNGLSWGCGVNCSRILSF